VLLPPPKPRREGHRASRGSALSKKNVILGKREKGGEPITRVVEDALRGALIPHRAANILPDTAIHPTRSAATTATAFAASATGRLAAPPESRFAQRHTGNRR
jgi:hypothetical protein